MELIKKFWGKIKWPLFLILWTIGTISWVYFYQEFSVIQKEAEWAYAESVRLKTNGDSVQDSDEKPKTESFVAPEGREEVKSASLPPSGEIEKIIYETFGEKEYKTALAVATAESHLRPEATNTNVNGTTDCGVFQINSIHGLKDCHDPHKNIRYAKELFDRSGWRPWTAYKTGKYLTYIK